MAWEVYVCWEGNGNCKWEVPTKEDALKAVKDVMRDGCWIYDEELEADSYCPPHNIFKCFIKEV